MNDPRTDEQAYIDEAVDALDREEHRCPEIGVRGTQCVKAQLHFDDCEFADEATCDVHHDRPGPHCYAGTTYLCDDCEQQRERARMNADEFVAAVETQWPWWEVTIEVPATLRARVQAASESAVRQAVIDGDIYDWSASYESDDNPDIIEIERIG